MEVETGSMLKCMCMCLALRRGAINNTYTMKDALVDGKVCVPCGRYKVQGRFGSSCYGSGVECSVV